MSKVRIVLQARLSSRRLPAKCLLPIGKLPLVALSALRAANTGLSTVLATSEETEDDLLAAVAKEHGVACIRGSLSDVYSRFLVATQDLQEDDWVVRLTADNCFPDGHFIEALIQQADNRELHYLGTSSPLDGLPYGMSAEVFTVSALRSVAGDLSDLDREHVTPAIRRKYGAAVASVQGSDKAQLRCTIDTSADYFRILALFSKMGDPLGVSWKQLCEDLEKLGDAPQFRIPWKAHSQGVIGKITLGTAQLGLSQYGRVNQTGRPSDEEAFKILDVAVRHGITHMDTASAYGDAEDRIGALVATGLYTEPTIITKLSPLANLAEDAPWRVVEKWVEASIYKSAHALRKQTLPIVMLHRWSHYRSHSGQVWNALKGLKARRVIGQLGASVYSPEEAIEALQDPLITHLQIPFNIIDHRWRSGKFEAERLRRPDVIVYARSAYLQGILLAGKEHWPLRKGFDPDDLLARLDQLVTQFGRQNRADLCIAYLQGASIVDSLAMGVETVSQLEDNLLLAMLPPLHSSEMLVVEHTFNDTPEWLLDPSQWS